MITRNDRRGLKIGGTDFDQSVGNELSVMANLVYGFENEDTDCQNGIDGPSDWQASTFFAVWGESYLNL